MSGPSRRNAALDPRRKRNLFRAWHRGTREMDLLMGGYTENAIAGLDEAAMADLETLIDLPDRDLFSWIAQGETVPPEYDTPVFRAMKAFHVHDKPLDL